MRRIIARYCAAADVALLALLFVDQALFFYSETAAFSFAEVLMLPNRDEIDLDVQPCRVALLITCCAAVLYSPHPSSASALPTPHVQGIIPSTRANIQITLLLLLDLLRDMS